ncbi:hypothetical protein BDZ97DRAFT_111907 [Flammula alnicola]|nr:hypothetical protein BDZ97DRAFT_111907 [Flammula alnicola]
MSYEGAMIAFSDSYSSGLLYLKLSLLILSLHLSRSITTTGPRLSLFHRFRLYNKHRRCIANIHSDSPLSSFTPGSYFLSPAPNFSSLFLAR